MTLGRTPFLPFSLLLATATLAAAPPRTFPLMRPDGDTLRQWQADHRALPPAPIDLRIQARLLAAENRGRPTSVDLLPYLRTPAAGRDQGNCGDCWVWGSTALAEISLGVAGHPDGLSVQYFDSTYAPTFACCGGDLATFARACAALGSFVPSGNANAGYQENWSACGGRGSAVDPATISTRGRHWFKAIEPAAVATSGVGRAKAIANLKNVLNQHRAVAFSFYMPDTRSVDAFLDFWENQDEGAVWRPETDRGHAWNPDTGAGHMVAIVGYDDSDPDPGKHCWVALNSWGTPDNRPHGLFRIAQGLDYDAFLKEKAEPLDTFTFETLAVAWNRVAPLAIQTSPLSQELPLGGSMTLTVAPSGGEPPFAFQWRLNGAALPGADAASCRIAAMKDGDAGLYDVVVTDAAACSVASAKARVTLALPGRNLLDNGDFEQGIGGWQGATGGIGSWNLQLPMRGSRNAWLGMTGDGHPETLYQQVDIPADAVSARLTYYLHVDAPGAGAASRSRFQVSLAGQPGPGAKAQVLATFTAGDAAPGYRAHSVDVSAWRGRTATVAFECRNEPGRPVSYVLDDVSLTVVDP